ncbi:MAG: polysaccharide deacetylase family protein, partial [Anaerolineales bacterium]|nr:polysaccharide deacetylase family protein [Anaerolineales bacterium]
MPAPTLRYKILSKAMRMLAPRIPLSAYRRWMPRAPLGFFYHAVSDAPLPHLQHLYPSKTATEFEQDLLWLKQNYPLLNYSALLDLADQPTRPTTPSAFLSFDDGFAECYTVARPLLLKHRVPGLFFLATDWVDNQAMYYRGKMSLILDLLTALDPAAQTETLQRLTQLSIQNSQFPIHNFQSFSAWLLALQQSAEPLLDQICETLALDLPGYLRTRQPFLTRAQIREMQAEGFIFGAHTRRHPKLNTLSQAEQAAEIVESCRIVCEITGQDQVPFAFPFSGNGVDRDFLARLRAQNPHLGLIFDTQKLRRDHPFIFHRIWADKPL